MQDEIVDGKAQKEAHWQELLQTFSRVGDRLGRDIDDGILETVVALNALGIRTQQSCEGHLDHGIAAPWIDVEPGDLEPFIQQVDEAYTRAKEVSTREAWDEAQCTRQQLLAKGLVEAKKVFDLLQEFYTGREAPFEARLTLRLFGRGTTRVESQGGMLQDIQEPGVRPEKLTAYQQEMRAFTEFLKKKYFEEEYER